MSVPSEHTSGIDEARKALAQSKASRRRTTSVVRKAASTTATLNAIAAAPDVLTEKLRAIIRGAA